MFREEEKYSRNPGVTKEEQKHQKDIKETRRRGKGGESKNEEVCEHLREHGERALSGFSFCCLGDWLGPKATAATSASAAAAAAAAATVTGGRTSPVFRSEKRGFLVNGEGAGQVHLGSGIKGVGGWTCRCRIVE